MHLKAIAVDTGGTFTDMVVLDQDTGEVDVLKLPSTPSDPGEAIIAGLKELLVGSFAPGDVLSLSHGTTVGTNRLLQGQRERIGLFVTEGFGGINDVWHLPRQEDSTGGQVYIERLPPVLPRFRREAAERVNADGDVTRPLDREAAAEAVRSLARLDIDAIAVVLLFSFLNPAHEEELAEIILKEIPNCSVSLSSRILPQVRERPRLSTTVANANIDRAMSSYLVSLEHRIREQHVTTEQLYVMQSNGGIGRLSTVVPITTVLSGPCAGAQAGMQVGQAAGFANVVSLDMGGTSTDIALGQDGRVLETTTGRVGDWELAVPMLTINTIGAGGGTIARVDGGGGMRVGPESAGADPGPACYEKGGTEPTVTDATLVLGFLDHGRKLGGRVALNRQAAERAIAAVGDELGLDVLQTAEGIVRITNAKMEEGIRAVSTEVGYDLRDFALVAFGGAGPIPAGMLASDLKMTKVVVPPSPGVTSAMGLVMADLRRDYVRSRLRLMSELTADELATVLADLRGQAEREFEHEGFGPEEVILEFFIDIRYLGQGYELTIPIGNESAAGPESVAAARRHFDEHHEQLFGHNAPGEEAEAVNYRARATVTVPKVTLKRADRATGPVSEARTGERPVCFDAAAGSAPCPIYDRTLLKPGHAIDGPAVVEQLDSTTVVYPGQSAVIDDYLNIVITTA